MTTIPAADTAVADALDRFIATSGKEGVHLLGAPDTTLSVDVIPTGILAVDAALGVGGIPRGRITELYGPEGGGKSTIALLAAVQAQQAGGAVGLVDAENAFTLEYALALGIDPQRFVVYQPLSGEDGVEMVEKMVASDAFSLVIVDSVAALVPEAEMDADMSQQHMGLHARLMSKSMRRLTAPVAAHNVALLLINQVRASLGEYNAPERSTGGRAIKFAASVRMEVRSAASKRIERNKVVVGQQVQVKVTKNRCGPPFRTATFDLYFGVGIDPVADFMEVAEASGLIVRAGASYTDATTGERLGVGKDAVRTKLTEEPELLERLRTALRDHAA